MIHLDHRKPNFYTEEHAALVQTFANQVGIAIEKTQLYQAALRAAERELGELLGVSGLSRHVGRNGASAAVPVIPSERSESRDRHQIVSRDLHLPWH